MIYDTIIWYIGTFPKEITKLRSLDGIFINYNSFTGNTYIYIDICNRYIDMDIT